MPAQEVLFCFVFNILCIDSIFNVCNSQKSSQKKITTGTKLDVLIDLFICECIYIYKMCVCIIIISYIFFVSSSFHIKSEVK